jgi:hypothetical protein
VGGLFLAFPVILRATASLVQKHEIEKKQAAGLHGKVRGRWAAALESAGAAIGSVGLFGFANGVTQYKHRKDGAGRVYGLMSTCRGSDEVSRF